MCGRYAIRMQMTTVKDRLGIPRRPKQEVTSATSVNFPPGLFNSIVAPSLEDRDKLEVSSAYWGFLPSWADKASLAQHNARLETADTKPWWRKAFRRRCCVIPVSWWYEWQRSGEGKQPFAIRPSEACDGFFFAGVWSVAKSLPAKHKAANDRTYAILTMKAHTSLAGIHHRMPIALTDEGAKAWLAEGEDTADLHERLEAGMHSEYATAEVPTAINNVKNDDIDLVPEVIKRYPTRYWMKFGEVPPYEY